MACETLKIDYSYYFVDVNKTIDMPKGATKKY